MAHVSASEANKPKKQHPVLKAPRPPRHASPIMARLMVPLAALVMVLAIGAGVLLWQHNQRVAENLSTTTAEVYRDLYISLDQQARGLAAALHLIVADARVQRALRERNAETLLADWQSTFETLHRESNLTHFYFFDTNRSCLLRLHSPAKHGDIIDRFTALEAERTGKMASGLELGPLGTFTLRVVQPVFAGGKIVGYVELGKEVEDVLEILHVSVGFELAVVLRKEHLARQTWEEGMHMLGRDADWDALLYGAVIYATQGRLPSVFALWIDHAAGNYSRDNVGSEISLEGKDWLISAKPLLDAAGTAVGDLFIMQDVSGEKATFVRILVRNGIAGAILVALLIGSICILIRRTDECILAEQAALIESEKRLSIISDHTYDWEHWRSPEGNNLWASPSCKTITGYSDEEFTVCGEDKLLQIIHPDDKHIWLEHIREIDSLSPEHGDLDFRIVKFGGEIIWIRHTCKPIFGRDGESLGRRGSNRNISTRMEAKLELIENVNRYRTLFEQAPVGIIRYDQSGTNLEVNSKFSEIIGAPVEKLVGFDMLKNVKDEQFLKALENALSGQIGVYEGDYTSVTAGKTTSIKAVFNCLKSPDGTANGGLAIFDDITLRKQAEKRLVESLQRAELANKAKSQFLANMSHELRTPFNGILGMLQLLETTEIDDDQKGYITIAHKSGRRMTHLLAEIVELSKIESGMQVIAQDEFSPTKVLEDVLTIFSPSFQIKGISLQPVVEDSIPNKLVGDAHQIKKILGYLVSNALNFTEQGEVIVKIESLTECKISKCVLKLTVSDTGIGISKDKLETIFDLFTQIDESNTRRIQGLGLGLTNCKRLVELMNGKMHVESEPGKGSTFSCTIECELPDTTLNSLDTSFTMTPRRILVVEDDEVSAVTVRSCLTDAGHNVVVVTDGMVCLETLSDQDFDLILMDIQLAVMDGINTTKEIRKQARFGSKSNIPIIALTAYALAGDKKLFLDSGMDGYITKPVNFDELKQVIERVMEKLGKEQKNTL